MELFFNALWLLTSLAAISIWFHQFGAVERARERRWVRSLVGLGCLLTLMFPVISVSDDLYFEQWVIEDSWVTSSKDLSKTADDSKTALHDRHAPAVMLLGSAPNSLADPLAFLITEPQPTLEFITIAPTLGRAPPSLS
jgi:hypothetical protein